MSFIDVYRKDTGEKVRVPAHWVGTSLFTPFRKTPKQRATETPGGESAADDTTPRKEA